MNDGARPERWLLAEPDDSIFCDRWRGLSDDARSEIGPRGYERYRKLMSHVDQTIERLRREQENEKRKEPPLPVEHLPTGWELTCPPPRPYVLHSYIPRRAVSGLLGAGTASKTLLVCEWIAAITTGTPWRDCYAQQGDVVILTWEDETDDYHAKLFSLLNHARPELLPIAHRIAERLHIVPMHGSAARLVAPDERGRPAPTLLPQRVVDLVKTEFPETVQVFIETVSRANAADESNEALAMMVAAGEIIAQELDCGVTAVHHVSKAAAAGGIIDAHAGRGGSALADNCRASTVIAMVTADMPASLWPAGFTAPDFNEREIVLIENARSSYARKAARMHLERIYPERGAPYLRAVRSPGQADPNAPRRDQDAEKLIAWLMDDARKGQWIAEREIVKRYKEYGLTERTAGTALARAREGGSVVWKDEPQYVDKGRMVTRYRLAGACDK